MKAKMMIGGVVMSAVLGFASGAPAKTLQALLFTPDRSAGTTFKTCNGLGVWAHAGGYTSAGVLQCLARSFNNSTWVTQSACGATAVKQAAELRATGVTFCASAKGAWGAPGASLQQVCTVNNIFLVPNGVGNCVSHSSMFAMSNAF
jgi:hypothetical protein